MHVSLAASDGAYRLVDRAAVSKTTAQPVADPPSRGAHRPHALHRRSPKHPLPRNDPELFGDSGNDDGTSHDPEDDDETTGDLSVNDDSDLPNVGWCQALVYDLIDLEAGARILPSTSPSARFPGFHRLRC
jgi:hypothetical protein